MQLTDIQRAVLEQLRDHPSGRPFREADEKAAIDALCAEQLVCDPHTMGEALFTRITDKGLSALSN